ncbi:transglycosylase family protein [Pseudonocardia sp. ICBG601]|uniref:transglycosylase family protein n=1 Tax=Pseudonocardia sp. ICBG601 TaxID=2846759 RepID=UPI0027E24F60|nr:transglycosylase family protein [Pseudonocardia sp. ICBG601]
MVSAWLRCRPLRALPVLRPGRHLLPEVEERRWLDDTASPPRPAVRSPGSARSPRWRRLRWASWGPRRRPSRRRRPRRRSSGPPPGDKLAHCESTGNWDADTGNGFKGGLQFTPSTWKEFGGRKYAPSAEQATKAQQIEIAKKVQDEQGWKAWPACTEKLGWR